LLQSTFGTERILANRRSFVQPVVDVHGPLVAVAVHIPEVFVEHGAAAGGSKRQKYGCQSDYAAAKMKRATRQGIASWGEKSGREVWQKVAKLASVFSAVFSDT
jgi:hypothetical protein